MKCCGTLLILVLVFVFVSVAGCDGPFRTPWHAETLASGGSIKVTSFNLVWGSEHDEHVLGQDCFAIEYVTSYPDADEKRREAEAAEAFELVRPVSEQWGFRRSHRRGNPDARRQKVSTISTGTRRQGRWPLVVHDGSPKWSAGLPTGALSRSVPGVRLRPIGLHPTRLRPKTFTSLSTQAARIGRRIQRPAASCMLRQRAFGCRESNHSRNA